MKLHLTMLSRTAGLVAGCAVLIGPALAQQQNEIKVGAPKTGVLCPQPGALTLRATVTASVTEEDFPPLGPTQKPATLGVFGDDQVNHTFRYTFTWAVPDKLCCEITAATLTVELRWNGGAGHLRTASNDKIAIMSKREAVAGMLENIWGSIIQPRVPDPPTKKITMTMNAAALKIANAQDRLSFQVQDDTTVLSAVLEMNGCCIAHLK